jgi:hypothetical protein
MKVELTKMKVGLWRQRLNSQGEVAANPVFRAVPLRLCTRLISNQADGFIRVDQQSACVADA